MFGLIVFAAFQASPSWGDLIALFALSVLAVYMKRFGRPRPALLIGFVRAKQVEQSVCTTVTAYGWRFFERPIVIVLILLTVASFVAAIRFKPSTPLRTVDGPHSHRGRGPQLIFYGLLVAATATVLIDSLHYRDLSAIYPQVAVSVALAAAMPQASRRRPRRRPETALHHPKDAV